MMSPTNFILSNDIVNQSYTLASGAQIKLRIP